MTNKILLSTISGCHDLPMVKLSNLFERASDCNHSSRYDAIASPFERTLNSQGYVISKALNGYSAGLTKMLFLKPNNDLLESINNSVMGGKIITYVSLELMRCKTMYMIKFSMMTPRCNIRFTSNFYAGCCTVEDYEEIRTRLNEFDHDSSINLLTMEF